jgi:hypothetical protein
MTTPIYDASIPALIRGLSILETYAAKAAEDAAARGYEQAVLVGARLAPDMMPLSGQFQRASDTAKAAIPRLTGIAAPAFADTETSFEQLAKRVADTAAFLQGVSADAFAESADRTIELRFGQLATTLPAWQFVTGFLLPNFYFHVTMVHAVLRHNGVKVGKLDYLGGFPAA